MLTAPTTYPGVSTSISHSTADHAGPTEPPPLLLIFNIMLRDLNPTPVGLSPQAIVNCEAGGSCNGGDPSGVYYYAYHTGIPDSTCMVYEAKNLDAY